MKNEVKKNLHEASLILDGFMELDPRNQETFISFYVERPSPIKDLLREAERAITHDRDFHWFFTGFTGAGKTTELNRILSDENLNSKYLPIKIDINQELDVNDIVYTDVILIMAKACAALAEQIKCPVSKEIREHIFHWSKEVISESEATQLKQAQGSIGIKNSFFSLSAGVQSDHKKRKIIREKIYDNVTDFIRLLDDLSTALTEYSKRKPLCILDGLDHVDYKPSVDLFNKFYQTITKPKLSKLFVIHVCMLHDNHFGANIERQRTLLPNIKVYSSSEKIDFDPEGFRFYKDVISRYVDLSLFRQESLNSLFEISAGIVRDMIRLTGIACGIAEDDGASVVESKHTEILWDREMKRFRDLLEKPDYDILREVNRTPLPLGPNRFGHLLPLKAILFYPNGEGWYGLHPVVRRLIEKS